MRSVAEPIDPRRRASRVACCSLLACCHPPPRRSGSDTSSKTVRSVPAFPQSKQGRPSHRVFRGRLGVHSCYGLPTRRQPFAASFLPGFDRFVTSTIAGIATRPGRPLPGRDLHPLEQQTFARHTWTSTPQQEVAELQTRTSALVRWSCALVGATPKPVHTRFTRCRRTQELKSDQPKLGPGQPCLSTRPNHAASDSPFLPGTLSMPLPSDGQSTSNRLHS